MHLPGLLQLLGLATNYVDPPDCFIRAGDQREGTLSWLHRFRRLKIRYEHRADIHLVFLQLGCALISLGFLS